MVSEGTLRKILEDKKDDIIQVLRRGDKVEMEIKDGVFVIRRTVRM